jgi:electron transfer flavoprotein alpha/beta subunit
MKIVVAYKWTRDPEEARAGADGTVDWSRAKPGLSAYDPVAIELARRLAEATERKKKNKKRKRTRAMIKKKKKE